MSSALATSIGLGAGVRLAAALYELPYACGLATVLAARDRPGAHASPAGGQFDVAAASTAGQ